MVDGDGVDDDGDEDCKEIPLPGLESRTNLTPETKIVVVTVMRIANRSVLMGLRFFGVYKASREKGGRDDAPWAGGTGWRALGPSMGFWPCGPHLLHPKAQFASPGEKVT